MKEETKQEIEKEAEMSEYAKRRGAELEIENRFWLHVLINGLRAGILPPFIVRREKQPPNS